MIRRHQLKTFIKKDVPCGTLLCQCSDNPIRVHDNLHLTKPCRFAMPCFIPCPISSASCSVNSLFARSLSISSSFLAFSEMACRATSLHFTSLCFCIILCKPSGTARVMLVIYTHLTYICEATYLYSFRRDWRLHQSAPGSAAYRRSASALFHQQHLPCVGELACLQMGDVDACRQEIPPAVPAVPQHLVAARGLLALCQCRDFPAEDVVDGEPDARSLRQVIPDGGGGVEWVGEILLEEELSRNDCHHVTDISNHLLLLNRRDSGIDASRQLESIVAGIDYPDQHACRGNDTICSDGI